MKKTLAMEMKILAEDTSLKHQNVLEEGIKYFKTSAKIEKAIVKAEAAFQAGKENLDPADVKKVAGIIKRMKMAKAEFAKVENSFSTGGSKEIAKKKFKILKMKYSDIYRDITRMRDVLTGAGIFLGLGTAAFLLLRFVFPDVAPNLVGVPEDEQLSRKVHKMFNDGLREVDTTAKGIGKFYDKFKANPDGVFKEIQTTVDQDLKNSGSGETVEDVVSKVRENGKEGLNTIKDKIKDLTSKG